VEQTQDDSDPTKVARRDHLVMAADALDMQKEHSQMAQGMSDRLVHILLALSCLEVKDTPTE
jgi:hypothetical protein